MEVSRTGRRSVLLGKGKSLCSSRIYELEFAEDANVIIKKFLFFFRKLSVGNLLWRSLN